MVDGNNSPRKRRRFQFGTQALFLLTLLASVAAATLAMALRPGQDVGQGRALFVLAAVAAPVAVMIVLSLIQAVYGFIAKRRPPND